MLQWHCSLSGTAHLMISVLQSRFLAEPGKLVLHPGVRKAGLMGFCDVAPGEMKHLRVAYLSAGRAHICLLTDLQVGCILNRFGMLTRFLSRAGPAAAFGMCRRGVVLWCCALQAARPVLVLSCRAQRFLIITIWSRTRPLLNVSVQ